MAGGIPVQIGSAAKVISGTAATGRAAGAAAVQIGGTDNAPTVPAPPKLADAAVPAPTLPTSTPVREPLPPAASNAAPAAPLPPAAITDACPAVPTIPSTMSTIPTDPAPLPTPAPTVPMVPARTPASGAKLANRSTSDDEDDVDVGDARLCSAWGTAESSCEAVDMTVCAEVPGALAALWATAADCAANPAVLVVGAGAVNGINWV